MKQAFKPWGTTDLDGVMASDHSKAHYGGSGCAFGLLALLVAAGVLLYFAF